MTKKDDTLLKHYIHYQDILYQTLKGETPSESPDNAAFKLHKSLRTLSPSTPLLRELTITFIPDVYTIRHRLLKEQGDDASEKTNKQVLSLMRQLDNGAKMHNYKDFKKAMFELDNLDEDRIKYGLAQLIGIHQKLRDRIARQKDIRADNFHEQLRKIGMRPIKRRKWKILDRLVRYLDYDNLQQVIDFEDSESQKDILTKKIDANTIIVRTPIIKSVADLKLFLNELSKAILIFYREDGSIEQFFRPGKLIGLSSMMEHALKDIVCTKTERYFMERINALENSYYAALALFDFDLSDTRENPSELFRSIMHPVYPVKYDRLWAQHIAKAGQPLMAHYKPIGYIMHQNLKAILRKERLFTKKRKARWLKENVLTRSRDIGLDTLI